MMSCYSRLRKVGQRFKYLKILNMVTLKKVMQETLFLQT